MEHNVNTVNEHCLNNIIKLSQVKQVTAAEDIFDERGTKLWARDAEITPALQERLLKRKLRKPLEKTLAVAGGINSDAILQEALNLYDTIPALSCFMGAEKAAVLETLTVARLDPVALLLLTTAHENGSGGFRHAVLVSLIATSIGIHRASWGVAPTVLALGGLLHDIGELYINPDYLYSKRKLLPDEWKHVAVHPRIGQMVLEDLAQYPQEVSRAVGEHHERFDGTGYPRQSAGAKISAAGQILAIAEMLSGIISRKDNVLARSCLAMKLVPGEHPHELISLVSTLRRQHNGSLLEPGMDFKGQNVVLKTQQVAGTLSATLAECDRLEQEAGVTAAQTEFVQRVRYRITVLSKALKATGIEDCLSGADLAAMSDEEGEICLELDVIGREIEWRLRDIAREVSLRLDDTDQKWRGALSGLIAKLDGGV
ncbi:MAG: HD domain-containing phosphohydrolase [Pseudomonadota bacterium]